MVALKRLLRRVVPSSLRRKYRERNFDESKVIYNGISYKDYLQSALVSFRPDIIGRKQEALIRDIKHAFGAYHIRPDEYLLYNFDHSSKKVRDSYLPQKQKNSILIDYYGSDWNRIVWQLQDKYSFYSLARPFFKRDVVKIATSEDWREFELFCKSHSSFICKIIDRGCGLGISKYEVISDQQARDLFDKLLAQGSFIVEELIKQNETMALFNSSSVNTIRYLSFRHGNKVIGAYPVLRTGRAGCIVDNAGQGGVFASIDIDSGIVSTNGFDEKGHEFDCHPDSRIRFKGFVIPEWKELTEEAKRVHLSLPREHVYVAFDFALSDKGWMVVEGNWGEFIMQQTSLKRGLKKEFVRLLEEE